MKPDPGSPADKFRARAIEALKSHGLRITGPRLEVVRVLAEACEALTPYQIHTRVVEAGGQIDVVSVYRILNAFRPTGLVHHIGAVDGYLACTLGHNHDQHSRHLVCRNCSRVVELGLDDQVIGQAITGAQEAGFGPAHVHVEVISDQCDSCRSAGPNA